MFYKKSVSPLFKSVWHVSSSLVRWSMILHPNGLNSDGLQITCLHILFGNSMPLDKLWTYVYE